MTTPPERLRQELEQQRDLGRRFGVAWRVAVSTVVRDLPLDQAVFWRRTFREQRSVWLCSFDRHPWPASRKPCLVGPVDDSADYAPVSRGQLVA